MLQGLERSHTSPGRLKNRTVALIIILIIGVVAGGTYLPLGMSNTLGHRTSVTLQSVTLYAPGNNPNMTGGKVSSIDYVLKIVSPNNVSAISLFLNGTEVLKSSGAFLGMNLRLTELKAQNYTTISHEGAELLPSVTVVANQTYNFTMVITFTNADSFKVSEMVKAM